MIIKNFINIKNKSLFFLNILFSSLPIIFMLPIVASSIFSLFFCAYTFFFFHSNSLKIQFENIDKILLIFFLFLICSSIINKDLSYNNIIKDVGVIRFYLIYILIKNILNYDLIKIKFFFLISFLCVFFLSFNILLIHLIGNDIFLNRMHDPNVDGYQRVSSVFGERKIAGSYLFSFYFFTLFFFLFKAKKSNILLFFLITLFIGLVILLTFDRTPFILLILSTIIINILYRKKNFVFNSLIIFSLFTLLILTIPKINNRFSILNNFINEVKSFYYKDNETLSFRKKILNKETDKNLGKEYEKILVEKKAHYSYFNIYIETISIIKFEKTFFGSGKSTYYKRCFNYRTSDPLNVAMGFNHACQNHSHNLYLEIGIASGIIGLTIFSLFLILKILNFIKILINLNNQDSNKFFYFILFFTMLIIEIFPLRPFGNVFSSYNGFLFFFKIAFIYAFAKKEFKLN